MGRTFKPHGYWDGKGWEYVSGETTSQRGTMFKPYPLSLAFAAASVAAHAALPPLTNLAVALTVMMT